jgi:UDP-N-acetylmuramoylalanine--D-glutamate ligase
LVPESEIPELAVGGRHNRANAVRAATAALGVGCGRAAVGRGLSAFAGLPGRLELVATIQGRRFYNDTASTTPESTIAALETLGSETWLLAGGCDKGSDLAPLSEAVVRSARGAALFGALRNVLAGMVRDSSPRFPSTATETMEEALRWCWQRSTPGESIVLSPACSSHDQFQNFQERGARFVASVRALRDPHDRSR